MKREDIIRMAREASNTPIDHHATPDLFGVSQIERFAALVAAAKEAELNDGLTIAYMDGYEKGKDDGAAAEREALEKIDWTVLLRQGALLTWGDAATLADRVITAIRARGNT